jgi:phosphohistidine phosphatase
MDLILWRHAEAVESAAGEPDIDRALTSKGERQAQRMAAWLNQQLPAGAKLLVSPARRAQQTAAALDRKTRTVAELAPEGTVEALLHAVRWPEAREPVVVVGHQPTLGLAAGYLMTGQALPWSVRKGAAWWLRGRVREGQLQVVLHALVSPELV